MKLIVGLGNPGDKYARNRHNVGFLAVDRIAERHRFPAWRRRFQGLTTEATLGGERVVLLKPDTYMNESGRSVGEAARFLKIPEADIVVLHDELDLAPGKLKIKTGGGNAGHNGLRSISAHVGNEYVRVRIGIGHPGSKDAVIHFVLHDFAKADMVWLEPMLDAIAEATPRLAAGDQSRFLTEVARATQLEEPKPRKAKAGGAGSDERATEAAAKPAPATEPREPSERAASKPRPSSHPAGERAGKRQSAIADNLRKWLAARKSGD